VSRWRLVPEVGAGRKGGNAEASGPEVAGNQGVAFSDKALAFGPGEFTLSGADSHLSVEAVGLASLGRGSGPVLKDLGAEVLQVRLSLPGGSKKSFPVGFVHDGKVAATPARYLVGGELLDVQAGRLRENVGGGNVVGR